MSCWDKNLSVSLTKMGQRNIIFILAIFIFSCQNGSDTTYKKSKKDTKHSKQRIIKSIISRSFIYNYFSSDSLVFEDKVIQYFDTLGQFVEMRKYAIDSTRLFEHHYQKLLGDTLLKIDERIGDVFKPKMEIDTAKYLNDNIVERKSTSTYSYDIDKNGNEIEIPIPTRVFYEYGKNGKLKSTKELNDKNIYECTYTYNSNNQLEIISCRNSNSSKNSYVERVYYNKKGLKIQKTEASYKNDRVVSQYKRLYKYDVMDSLIYQSWYRDGINFIIYNYGFNKQRQKLTEELYNDSSGDSTQLSQQSLYLYDKKGNLKEFLIVGKNGEPIQTILYFYNKDENLLEERKFTHLIDADKKAVLNRRITQYYYEYY